MTVSPFLPKYLYFALPNFLFIINIIQKKPINLKVPWGKEKISVEKSSILPFSNDI